MTGRRLTFEELEHFYSQMASFANDDEYCVCSPYQIVSEMGKPAGSLEYLLAFLVKTECLREHVSPQERQWARPVAFYSLGKNVFTRKVYDKERRAEQHLRDERLRERARTRKRAD